MMMAVPAPLRGGGGVSASGSLVRFKRRRRSRIHVPVLECHRKPALHAGFYLRDAIRRARAGLENLPCNWIAL